MHLLCYLLWFVLAIVFNRWHSQLTPKVQDELLVRSSYQCFKTKTAPLINGFIDDPEWTNISWSTDFKEIRGFSPTPNGMRTRVKMIWDEQYLYIAAELEEPHISASILKKNTPIYKFDNNFEVFLDPDADHHNYYELEMNALNSIWELTLPKPYKDGGIAKDPDNLPGLRTAIAIHGTINKPEDRDTSWTLEIALPWRDLDKYNPESTPPQHGQRWRVNFSRVQWDRQIENGKYYKEKNKEEVNYSWSPQGAINMHLPERWGDVFFYENKDDSVKSAYERENIIREQLNDIYELQKKYFREHKRYANSIQDLGASFALLGYFSAFTPKEYIYCTNLLFGNSHNTQICINHFSRIWKTNIDK